MVRAADVLRRDRAGRARRPRQLLAQGARHAAHPGPAAGRVPRPHRQRGRDDRAPARQRAHHADGVRVQRRAPDLAHLRDRHRARAGHARVRRARRALPRAARPPGGHRHRGRPGHHVVRLRGAAHGPRRRPRPAARLGDARRATTRSSTTERKKNAREHRRPARDRAREHLRGAASRGRESACSTSASTCCCCRSAPTCRTSRATRRCRSNGSRCSCSRRTGDAKLVVPRLEAPRVTPQPDLFEIVPWEETDDPIRLVAKFVGPDAGHARDRRHHVGALRARSPTGAAVHARSSRATRGRGADPDGEGRARDRGAARRGRTPSTTIAVAIRERPFVGRSELDIHRELVERMLAAGHERSNFAIVAAGDHAASPHHEPSADAGRRGRRHRAVRLRRHDARLLLRHHAHVPRGRAARRGARRLRRARRGAGSGRARRDGRHAVRGGRRRVARA